jgi:hypothetical protein
LLEKKKQQHGEISVVDMLLFFLFRLKEERAPIWVWEDVIGLGLVA